jgi:hypothetical protein
MSWELGARLAGSAGWPAAYRRDPYGRLLSAGPEADSRAGGRSAGHRYYSENQRAGFILLCTARPKSPMRIRTDQRDAMRAHRRRYGLPTPRG